MFDYKPLEIKLNEALALVSGVLSQDQVEDIRSYIYAGEWGLALEFVCSMLYEDELPLPARAYELLQEVGNTMHLESKTWEVLKPQVADSSNHY